MAKFTCEGLYKSEYVCHGHVLTFGAMHDTPSLLWPELRLASGQSAFVPTMQETSHEYHSLSEYTV